MVDYSAPFRQLPVHDAECIIWIILDFLLKAIPEGGNPEVTRVASSALKVLVNHTPEPSADSRRCFREFFSREWLHSLHPKLSHLAPMLCEFSSLLDFNWTLLCIKGLLPQDILHEAVKRVFLQEIVHIRTERCDVRLELEIRRPLVWVPKTIGASPSTKRKSVSVVESTSKRTRYDWPDLVKLTCLGCCHLSVGFLSSCTTLWDSISSFFRGLPVWNNYSCSLLIQCYTYT